MPNAHRLAKGTWIRSNVPVSDGGDYNERSAPAGALGLIDDVEGTGAQARYSVVFWPTFISNSWDAAEIDAEAEVLPAGHPDIPSAASYDLASATADILADGDVRDDDVKAPASALARIRAAVAALPAMADVLDLLPSGRVFTYEQFDALASRVGIGDRLSGEPNEPAAPSP